MSDSGEKEVVMHYADEEELDTGEEEQLREFQPPVAEIEGLQLSPPPAPVPADDNGIGNEEQEQPADVGEARPADDEEQPPPIIPANAAVAPAFNVDQARRDRVVFPPPGARFALSDGIRVVHLAPDEVVQAPNRFIASIGAGGDGSVDAGDVLVYGQVDRNLDLRGRVAQGLLGRDAAGAGDGPPPVCCSAGNGAPPVAVVGADNVAVVDPVGNGGGIGEGHDADEGQVPAPDEGNDFNLEDPNNNNIVGNPDDAVDGA